MAVLGRLVVATTVRGWLLLLLLAVAIVLLCVVGVTAIGWSVGCGGGCRTIGSRRGIPVGSWGGGSTVVSSGRGSGCSGTRRGSIVVGSLLRRDDVCRRTTLRMHMGLG